MNNKILMSGLVALSPLLACAAGGDDSRPDYLHVPDVTLDAAGKGTVGVHLNTYVVEYNSFMMDIYLPDGFTIDKNVRGKYEFKFNTEEGVVVDHTMTSADHAATDEHSAFVRVVAFSISMSYILPGDNLLFSFGITAPEGYRHAENGAIKAIDFAEGSTLETANDHILPDVSFTIIPDPTTGVENVGVDDGSVTVFNLQGVELLRDAPATSLGSLPAGLYIVNGEKRLVR